MSALIGSLRVTLGLDTAAFSTGLKQSQGKLSAFGALARKAILPLAAIGTAAAVGIGAAVNSTIDAADEMSKSAAKFGIPIEELSRLKYAADLSDVSMQTLGTSVGILSKKMVEAAKDGGGKAAEAFNQFGIAVTNADGSLRSSSDVLTQLADVMAAMPDGAEKTAVAMSLLGKGGKEMIPLLNGGAAALSNLMAETDKFGQVTTAQTGAAAEQFNDNMSRLKGAMAPVSAEITERILPSLVKFSEVLVANGPALAEFVGAIVNFGIAIADVALRIIGGLTDSGHAITGFRVALTDDMAGALASVQQFGTDAVAAINAFGDGAAAKIDEVAQIFLGFVEKMKQVGRDILDGLLAGLSEKWASVKAWFGDLAASIPQWVRDALGIHSPSTVFAEIGRNIMDGLAGGLDSNMAQVEGRIGSFASGLATTFADILTGATDWRDAMSSTLANVGDSLISSGLGGFGKALGIPGFANGTRFAPGGVALVGERGPELVHLPRGSQVTPNSQMGGMGGGVSINVSSTLNAPGADASTIPVIKAMLAQQKAEFEQSLPLRVRRVMSDPRYLGR